MAMMSIIFKSVGVVFLVIATVLVEKSAGKTYALGWNIPTATGGATSYSSWAAQHTFLPGDKLVFNFTTGAHDVAKVDKASFDSCSSTGSTSLSTSPATVILTSVGPQYFICTFSQHCSLGQKLSVKVSAASTPPSTSPPAPAPISIPTQTPVELAPAPASIVPTLPSYAGPPAPLHVPEAPLSPLSEGVPGPAGSFPPTTSATTAASSTILCMIISIAIVLITC